MTKMWSLLPALAAVRKDVPGWVREMRNAVAHKVVATRAIQARKVRLQTPDGIYRAYPPCRQSDEPAII